LEKRPASQKRSKKLCDDLLHAAGTFIIQAETGETNYNFSTKRGREWGGLNRGKDGEVHINKKLSGA